MIFQKIYPVAMSFLPAKMDSPEAKAMLFAIGMQESRFRHRRQVGGPARGFWQFELGGGVRGVLNHPSTSHHIKAILDVLQYDNEPLNSYQAIEHNDILACCYARLLLWSLPQSLPMKGATERAWNMYLSAWRPGKPHRSTWDAFYLEAWS